MLLEPWDPGLGPPHDSLYLPLQDGGEEPPPCFLTSAIGSLISIPSQPLGSRPLFNLIVWVDVLILTCSFLPRVGSSDLSFSVPSASGEWRSGYSFPGEIHTPGKWWEENL